MPSSTRIYTLSLHDALPISDRSDPALRERERVGCPDRTSDARKGRMPNYLSELTKREQARLLEELNYMNLEEIRRLCSERGIPDRKSTRLNFSHLGISYAVFDADLHSFPTRRSSDLGSE